MELYVRPLLLHLQLWRAFPLTSITLAIDDLGLDVSSFLVSLLPGPHISVWRFLISRSKLCETCPIIRQISWSIDFPEIINALLLLDVQIRMSSTGHVNVFQWNKECFFFRHIELNSRFNVMTIFVCFV